MKKVIYKAFIITLLGLTVSAPGVKANDVYVPFGEKKFTEIENSEKIEFDDLNLKEALIEYYKFHINKDFKGEEITVGMMEQFTSLSLPWKNIFSLKGLEYAVNLKNLNLSNNFIEDITPLEKLVELEDLNLTNNKIKDPKSLAKLTMLRQLVLRKNLMNNLDFLNDLKVESLDISMNSVLKDYIPNNLKLENLRSLNLSGIGLDNISFLKTLPVTFKKQYMMKLRPPKVLSFIIFAIYYLILVIALKENMFTYYPVVGLITAIFIIINNIELAGMLDLIRPNFNWKSETELTKRSLNSFLWTLFVFAKIRIIWLYCK